MPWGETTVLDDRIRFIAMYLDDQLSFTLLCREFGISRKTGYKYVERYDQYGPEGLHDFSRAPHSHLNAVCDALQQQIVTLKGQHPSWGPRKIRVLLADFAAPLPAASTVGAILKQNGLVTPRKRRHRASPTVPANLTQPQAPNDVWCADFKGHFGLGNRNRCYPLTITDAHSRTLLRCQALSSTNTDAVKPIWIGAFLEYGLPAVIRTDNGSPFASNGLAGLSRLSVWWIKLGIIPQRIQPAHPQQNGSHERMHRTLKAEATQPAQVNIAAQQRVFDKFKDEYNNIRPHEALGQRTPASIYVSSARTYPQCEPRIEYPSGMDVRRVRSNGEIRWHGDLLYVSESLVGEYIALDQFDDRCRVLYFGALPLALIDDPTRTWVPARTAGPILNKLLKGEPV